MDELILGIDLCDSYSQISIFSSAKNAPEPFLMGSDEASCLIPTVLCKMRGEENWLIASEAYRRALMGEGTMVDKLVKLYQCPVYISKEDEIMARDPYLNLSEEDNIVIHSPVQHLKEGTYQIGHFSVQVYETPGHTPGSLMFRIGNELFSGDTLFHMSIGRTDLPLGSNSEMRSSLQLIKTLDPALRVYPGHEEVTTLEYELEHNPYLY